MQTRSILATIIALSLASWITSPATAQVTETNIATARLDATLDGIPDNSGSIYRVTGHVSSPNFVSTFGAAPRSVEFYIQDTNDNAGILVFFDEGIEGSPYDDSDIIVGREIEVLGILDHTGFGVTHLRPTIPSGQITIQDTNEIVIAPVSATISALLASPETFEGTLVQVTNTTLTSGNWPDLGGSASLTIDDGTSNITLRIDGDTDLSGQLPPTNAFNVQGIFSQFDTSAPFLDGYQILPRFYSDVDQSSLGQVPPELVVSPAGAVSAAVGVEVALQLLGQDRNALDTLTFDAPDAPVGATVTNAGVRQAVFNWTPTAGLEGTTNTVSLTVSDGTVTVTQLVDVIVLTEDQASLVLNEIHFDPATGTAGDANGDGVRDSTTDEFLEFVNIGTNDLDISGWTITRNPATSPTELYSFPAGTIATADAAVVVFGGPTPVGLFGNAVVLNTSNNWAGLSNGGATIGLFDSNGVQTLVVDYGALEGFDGSGTDESLTRDPDGTGEFDLHTLADPTRRWSPGIRNDGSPFPGSGITNSAPELTVPGPASAGIGDEVVIVVTATDNESDPITLTVSNAPASAVFVDDGNGTGTLTYTGQVADAGTVFTLAFTASDGVGEDSGTVSLNVISLTYSGLIINEYLADPDVSAGVGFDSNNDGTVDGTEDEFVEIVNSSTNVIDLDGLLLRDGALIRHAFTPFSLQPGAVFVVFGGGSTASFANSPSETASSGGLGLNNTSADSVTLLDPGTNILDSAAWTTARPSAISFTRNPDITGAFENHQEASGFTIDASPGLKLDGSPFLANQPPTINPIADQSVQASNTLDVAITTVEGDGDTVSITVSNAPANTTFTNNMDGTADFQFTPDNSQTAMTFTVFIFASDDDGTNSTSFDIEVTAIPETGGPSDGEVWVNEFHYDNAGGDTGEGIEIAGPQGTDLSNYMIVKYNGSNNEVYSSDPINMLSGIIPNEMDCFGAVFFPISGLQNGSPDGFALVKDGTNVIQFLSYEGEMTAVGGPADGLTSEDVGVLEAGGTPVGDSLQLIGMGNDYAEFTWSGPTNGSPGLLNVDQTIVDGCGGASNEPPTILPISDESVQVSNTLDVAISTSEIDGDLVEITVSNAPINSSFLDNTDGTADFSFTPDITQTGITFTVFVFASDPDGTNSTSFEIEVTAIPPDVEPGSGEVWINELHYDNDGGDEGEGVEIAGPEGSDLSAYMIVKYNGSNNEIYTTDPTNMLSGIITNEQDCIGAIWFPISGLQNGAPDGLALVKDGTSVVQFLSYEGSMTAIGGPADGLTSEDIGVAEENSTPVGQSLQLIGMGNSYDQFTWSGPTNASPGLLNVGQIIVDGCDTGGVVDTDMDGMPDDYELEFFGDITNGVASADDDMDGADNFEEYIADTIPTNALSLFKINTLSNDTDSVFSYPSSSERLYQSQYTTNLVEPMDWTDLGAEVPGNDGTKSVTDSDDADFRNYRIKVRIP